MTQHQSIMKVLNRGKTLSAAQASTQLGIMNLRARICELREAGTAIITGKNKSGKTTYALA